MSSGPTFAIVISGIQAATGEMRAAIDAGILAGMNKIALLGEAEVKQEIEDAGAIDRGFLLNSVHATVITNPGVNVIAQISPGPPADVYAAPVEMGARPHMPPSSVLVGWVKRKLHITDEKAAVSLAFAIAKTIAKRGTRAVRMFEKTLAKLEGQAPEIIEREIAVAIGAAGLAPGGTQ